MNDNSCLRKMKTKGELLMQKDYVVRCVRKDGQPDKELLYYRKDKAYEFYNSVKYNASGRYSRIELIAKKPSEHLVEVIYFS